MLSSLLFQNSWQMLSNWRVLALSHLSSHKDLGIVSAITLPLYIHNGWKAFIPGIVFPNWPFLRMFLIKIPASLEILKLCLLFHRTRKYLRCILVVIQAGVAALYFPPYVEDYTDIFSVTLFSFHICVSRGWVFFARFLEDFLDWTEFRFRYFPWSIEDYFCNWCLDCRILTTAAKLCHADCLWNQSCSLPPWSVPHSHPFWCFECFPSCLSLQKWSL